MFADAKQVKKEINIIAAINPQFRIPAGAKDYVVEAMYQFEEDTLLFTVTPHMHLRGKAFRFEAIYPDGREEVLLDVPRFDFNWQNSYELVEPKPMPEGTKIRLHCPLRQLGRQPGQSRPDERRELGRADLARDGGRHDEHQLDGAGFVARPAARSKPLADGNYEVRFAYRPTTRVKTVHLAGDFEDWADEGKPMEGPDAEGRYTARLELPAGNYQYKFLLDGERRRVDPGNPVRDDQQQNSVLHVGLRN